MENGLKPILENQLLNEDTKLQIQEAWEQKINEAREEITNEIRNEFANKYDRDKSNIVEALDKKINESLQEQVDKLNEDREKLVQERVNYKKQSRQHAEKFLNEATKVLQGEMQEFQEDRKDTMHQLGNFGKFIENGIKESVQECYTEQQKIAEDRVKLRKHANKTLKEAKQRTISELAHAADDFVTKTLEGELSQLKDELIEARQNDFGRKIYEAFMSEFSSSFHNENREYSKLKNAISERESKLDEAYKRLEEMEKRVQDSQHKLKLKESQISRNNKLNDLLSPLGKESKELMQDMLSDVPTQRLEEAFNKYLPSLLEGSGQQRTNRRKINENKNSRLRDVTGDRKTLVENNKNESDEEVSQFLEAFHRIK